MKQIYLRFKDNLRSKPFRYFVILAAVLCLSVPTFAVTPVPLVIDTNDIMTQTNSWIGTFSPIIAIGIGMSLALAILSFIGYTMISAFKGRGAGR